MLGNDTRSDDFWEIFSSSGRLTAFNSLFLACFVFSIAINCLLLYLTLRPRNTRQPQYIILANLAVCDILMSVTPCVHLLPSVLLEKTAILSKWSIGFVPIFGNFMLMSLMTWTLLSAERYTFICQGLHYLRIVRTRYIRCALGVIWTMVVFLNTYHQLLIYYKFDFVDKPSDTLVCDPLTFTKMTELTSADKWLLRAPPGCIIILSVISIFAFNLLILRAAHKVCVTLRQSNRRASSNMGCYVVMFLVQTLPLPYCVIMFVLDKVHPELYPKSQLLLLLLMMLTPWVNAATMLYRTRGLKKDLRSLCSNQVRGRPTENIMLPVIRARRERETP